MYVFSHTRHPGATWVENKVQRNILASSCKLEREEGTRAYVPVSQPSTVESGQISGATIYLQNLNNTKRMAFADKICGFFSLNSWAIPIKSIRTFQLTTKTT